MTTLNNLYRAIQIAREMAPKLQELNDLLLELDREPIDERCKEKLDYLYRDLNDAEMIEEIEETLLETREKYYQSDEYLDNDEYEYDPEDYDPDDWDNETMIQPEYLPENLRNKKEE